MVRNILSPVMATCLGLSIFAVSSQALATYNGYSMNAMCYLMDKKGSQTQAFNPTAKQIKESGSREVFKIPTDVQVQDLYTKFRIASLSKILVSHWAVATLTPEYRFKTKVHVLLDQTDGKECSLHMEGDGDIFFGKEMLSTAFSQLIPILKQNNCKKISEVTYDENLLIPLGPNSEYIVSHRTSSGFRGNDPTDYYGPKTTKKALALFLKPTMKAAGIQLGEVQILEKNEFNAVHKDTPKKTFSFKSRPLYMMMREFNAYSSNVPPNILFERLGGRDEYNKFIYKRLRLDTNSVDVHNGSGYPVFLPSGKTYNEVNCDSLVRIFQDLDHMLRAYKGSRPFQMADIMGIAGDSKSLVKDSNGQRKIIPEGYTTFKSLYGNDRYTNTLVGKTGSAEQAITFGGMLSTSEGALYFAALTAPTKYTASITNAARVYVRDLVNILAKQYELEPFEFTHLGPMAATDKEADLVEEIPNLGAVNLSLK